MKKLLLIILMVFGFGLTISAQTQYYKALNFAIAFVDDGKYYWGEWSKCSVNITFDLDEDFITIYSNSIQVYKILDASDTYTDKEGGTQVKFYVIDQDYDRGTVRLRVQADGSSQIYVDFNDVAWVYGNIVRIK